MGARRKLNQIHLNGSLLLAGAVGVVARSWLIFFVVLVILVGASLYAREIRLKRHDRKKRSPSTDADRINWNGEEE